MKKIVFLVTFTAVLIGSPQLHAATEVWQKEFTAAPTWQRLTTDGNLIVSTASGLAVYRGPSGEQMWERDDLWATSASDVRFLGQSGLLLAEAMPDKMIGKKKKRRAKRKKGEFQILTAVDVLSGEDQWSLDFLRGELIDIRVINQDEIAFVFQSIKVKNKEESGIYLTAVDLANGGVLWETQYAGRRTKLTGKSMSGLAGHARITIQDGTAYIPFLGLHAIDMNTGNVKWQATFRKKTPEFISYYAPPLVADGVVYVSDAELVYAFDKISGNQLWRAKVRRARVIPEMQKTDTHLIVRFGGTFSNRRKVTQLSSFGVAAIDLESGKVIWNFDDARDGITNLIVQNDKNRVIFADAAAVVGLSIENGNVIFASPLAFYRQYGIFKAKKGGFSISGGYSKTGPGGTSGESGGLGGGGCSFNLGDLPIDISMNGEEIVVRGQSHIKTFDPRVMMVQWSAIFSDTDPSDRTLLATGGLPQFSQKDISYYLTEMSVGRGRSNHDQFILLGIAKEDGKVKSRLDIHGKDPQVIIDHGRDLVYVMNDGRKRSMQLTAYAL